MLSIGLMSGTSMDGVDAALLETDGDGYIKELGHCHRTYTPDDRALLMIAKNSVVAAKGNLAHAASIFNINLIDYLKHHLHLNEDEQRIKITQLEVHIGGSASFTELSLNSVIMHSTLLHIHAVQQLLNETHYRADQIAVIGYHGQTFLHQPELGISVIVGDGQMMADALQIPVVNQFRVADIAAGGLGAPFAPIYHYALAKRDNLIPMAVINCGGIANVTLIPDTDPNHLIGFDSGPGNGLVDRLVRKRSFGQEDMDKNGIYGSQGIINAYMLELLRAESVIKQGKNYLTMPAPKVLDLTDLKLPRALDELSLADACATLEDFTALTIAESVTNLNYQWPPLVVLAGGGWQNPLILNGLKQRLEQHNVKVKMAEEIGWSSQALEAQIFAYLAVRSLQGKPLSFPKTTKVSAPMPGGVCYQPHKQTQLS